MLAEGVVATAQPQVSVGLDLPVPEGLGDRKDLVSELDGRSRIVDEEKDVADVKARPSEPLPVVERECQRLRFAQVARRGRRSSRGISEL